MTSRGSPGTLPGDAGRAAAVVIATLPGAVLWHEGQFEGRRVHPPVFLSRRPAEPPDSALAGWYLRLLAAVAGRRIRSGSWRLLEAAGWPDNDSCRNLLAWSWDGRRRRRGPRRRRQPRRPPSQGRVPAWAGTAWLGAAGG